MSKALREQRAQAHSEGVRALAANNLVAFRKAMTEVDRLAEEIKKSEAQSGLPTSATFGIPDKDFSRAFAFGKFLRDGMGALTDAERRSVECRDLLEGSPMINHVGAYSGMGYLVPTGFAGKIEVALKYFAPLMEDGLFTQMPTSTGAPLPYPISNDTTQQAYVIGEGQPVSEDDLSAGQIIFGAYKLTSGLVKATSELLQDSAIDLEDFLANAFAVRYGRGLEFYLTNGTGIGQPTGLLTAIEESGAVPVTALGSAANTGGSGTGTNSLGYQDLVNLEYGVDPSYRRNGSYMLHDLTVASFKLLLDKFGRPLWTPGIAVGEPDRLNGYEYTVNMQFPQIGPSNVVMAFGDFSKFVVRKVSGWAVQRLTELFAITGEVGFISNMRVDSNLLDAGTHPINILQMHS